MPNTVYYRSIDAEPVRQVKPISWFEYVLKYSFRGLPVATPDTPETPIETPRQCNLATPASEMYFSPSSPFFSDNSPKQLLFTDSPTSYASFFSAMTHLFDGPEVVKPETSSSSFFVDDQMEDYRTYVDIKHLDYDPKMDKGCVIA